MLQERLTERRRSVSICFFLFTCVYENSILSSLLEYEAEFLPDAMMFIFSNRSCDQN